MPKIIVTSRYLKSGNNKNLLNYVKYIATREGSVEVNTNNGTTPATKKQQEFVSELLKNFPESKNSFEYADYKNNPTQKNASKFITETIETNADRIGNRKNYVGYLANRPGAVKFGSHGLFSQENIPINLNKVANEISNHGGNVWTHVVSLRRDDAQKMGYDNLNAWRELVKRQIPNIAKQSKIDLKNLKWYAAFHDKETNPHVHIIVYSSDIKEGFLTNYGIEKIRSGFANDIYSDELHHLYGQQNDTRNLLKKESEKLMKELVENISDKNFVDDELLKLISKLQRQLKNAKGKKVYGYLKNDTKKTVDEIFSRLAQNESIQKMYNLWCETEQSKHDIYSSAKVDFSSLVNNEHFKSVKNMIVKTILEIDKFANDTALFQDCDKAEKYLEIIADSGNEYAVYTHAKTLLNNNQFHDTEKAVQLLESIADKNNFASYQLGKIYLFGTADLECNRELAVQWLTKSAEDGNNYAYALLDNLQQYENEVLVDTALKLLVNICRIIEDDYNREQQKLKSQIDSKLKKVIQKKNQELGIKSNYGHSY